MTKIFKLFVITISISIYGCNSQTDKNVNPHSYYSKEFRLNWKTDSTGILGFREKYFSSSGNATINGVNLVGYSKDEIISIFGKPTNIGHGKEGGLLMIFYIINNRPKTPTETIIIDFDKKHKVTDITLDTGMNSF
jgi:hypothetical protein